MSHFYANWWFILLFHFVNIVVLLLKFDEVHIMKDKIIWSDEGFKNKVSDVNGYVLIKFTADWCGPCKNLSPILTSIDNEMDNLSIYDVNIEQATELASNYKVTSLPTLALFKDGVEIARKIGALPKAPLEKWLTDNMQDN